MPSTDQGAGAAAEGAPPLVSVVVPAYNAEATLMETLRSVAAQTYRHIEILIVDDGSTDRTAALAAAFCREDERARLIEQPNGGVASARNAGIRAARGAYVAPVDADDLWHPAKLERQVAAAQAAAAGGGPPGFVYTWFRLIDGDGRIIGESEAHRVDGPALRRLAYRNFVGNGSALLLPRAAALEAGGYDESLRARGAEGCEDIALQLAVARRHPIAAVPEYLVGYRFLPGAMSRNSERMFRSWQLTLEGFVAAGGEVPRRVTGWNQAIRAFGLAEQRAMGGDWAGCLRLVLRALRLDPARTLLHLAYRLLRFAGRLARGARPRPRGPHFLDAPPVGSMRFDPHEIPALARALERFDARRMARLGALDRAAGQPPASSPPSGE